LLLANIIGYVPLPGVELFEAAGVEATALI
jgi:hypothetical protein